MPNLINDGSLVGFWPLHEPSGAPFFKNYSPAYAKYPSGISFDMQVVTAASVAREEQSSFWPGGIEFMNPESGTLIRGYSVGGHWKTNIDSSPFSKYLAMGGGGRQQSEQCLSLPIANSGFTVGVWAYPNSDGYAVDATTFTSTASNLSANNTWSVAMARAHALIGQFSAYTNIGGWYMGVSGLLDHGAQYNNHAGEGLGAYVSMTKASNSAPDLLLEVPIESGRYTHLTMSYRRDPAGGSVHQLVLYKDGRVAASGTTNDNLSLSNTNLISSTNSRALAIGACDPEVTTGFANHYDNTSGWNNLVSGVYHFRRVLDEGEILDMHERGGLAFEEALVLPTEEVTLTDPDLVAYYPVFETLYGDVSMHHRPLISNFDMGYAGLGTVPTTGPFGGGSIYNDSANDSIVHAANSGVCYDLLSNGSWTIGLNVSTLNGSTRESNMLFSWGSVTAEETSALPVTHPLSSNTAGICCTSSGVTNQHRHVIEIYSIGSESDTPSILVFNIDGFKEFYDGAVSHLSLAYDDSTKGVAAYLNGVQQGSGTLPHSLTDQLMRVTGSGYPLLFGNGVQDTILDNSTRGVHDNASTDASLGQMFMVKRALLPAEIRAIATSGIDFTPIYRSHHDTRLVGYWPASDFKMGDIIVSDQARCWKEVPGDLVRGDAFAKQDRWYGRDLTTNSTNIWYNNGVARYDQFGIRDLPPELASEGNLGITSGTYTVRGGSAGTADVPDANDVQSSIGNVSSRHKANFERRNGTLVKPQSQLNEFVLSYEVTPSGDIPATVVGLNSIAGGPAHNSLLHMYGVDGGSDTRSYLTTLEAGSGSGVSLVWLGEDATPLVSGNLPYGVPSRVLLHGKFDIPNQTNTPFNTAGAAPYSVSLWIDGELIHRRHMTASSAALWSASVPIDLTPMLSFGGIVGNTLSYTTQFTNLDSGLGDIYLRNMFMMRGVFFKDEIEALATSGIQTKTISGFSNQQPTTQVSIADSNLVGYYRFNGFAGGGSGTSDLSLNANHLFGAQQSLYENSPGTANEGAANLRVIAGPLAQSDLGIQCSGFTYHDDNPPTTSSPHNMPPFMASGTRFNSPDSSFSVGFFYIKKNDVAASHFDAIVSYGTTPGGLSADTGTDVNFGWMIGQDSSENMKMVISLDGNMYLDNSSNAAQAGQLVVGTFGEGGSLYEDFRQWEQYRAGHHQMPRLDSWSHYCWVYDSDARIVNHYVNGTLIDFKAMKDGKNPQIPAEEARYLTFMQHTSDPWVNAATVCHDQVGVMTDFFYFDDALTEEEVRYISRNGIDSATGTVTSGVIGGYVRGQDTGSGIVGGFTRGQDTGSGLFGGFMPGGVESSGLFGGYVSGVVFGDGTVGGWIRGLDDVSGIMGGYMLGVDVGSGSIAGYIRGQEVGSGHFGGMIFASEVSSGVLGGLMFASDQASGVFGGFMLGGLQSNFEFDAGFTVDVLAAKDFDAQLEIAKTVASDFDAKVVIFQDEIPPLVDIIIPDASVSGLVPPFNQYFIAKASGQQGKTINSTKWTFGDFTPTETVAESGAGCYPVQHMYASSGFFIAKFEAIDSDGMHSSATRIISAASGIDPVLISLSGVPRSGNAGLIVDFDTDINILPPGVSVSTQLLHFDDGQTTIAFSPTHNYTQPGTYKPIWCVRDSRGVIWCDSLEAGNDFLESGGA